MKTSVTCSSKLISVAIEKASVPRLNPKNLHLRINSCKASENATHILFSSKPYECRTSVKSFGSTIEYSNIILEEDKATAAIVRRRRLFQLPFKCIFVPRLTQAITGFKARKTLVKFSGKAFFNSRWWRHLTNINKYSKVNCTLNNVYEIAKKVKFPKTYEIFLYFCNSSLD